MSEKEIKNIVNEEKATETLESEEFDAEKAVLAEKQKKASDEESNKYLHFKKGDTIKFKNLDGKVEEISATEAHKRLEKLLGTDNQRLMAKLAFIRLIEYEKVKLAVKNAEAKKASAETSKTPKGTEVPKA